MPTYTVTNSNFNISSKQQKKLAEGITKVHNVVTGANTYFAQVIFNKTKKNNTVFNTFLHPTQYSTYQPVLLYCTAVQYST